MKPRVMSTIGVNLQFTVFEKKKKEFQKYGGCF